MLIVYSVLVTFLFIGCDNKADVKPAANSETKTQTTQTAIGAIAPSGTRSGTVITTLNSAGYTYIEVDENGNKLWIAAPQTNINIGDKVSFPDGSMMSQFKSKSLDRVFDKIMFVSGVSTGSSPGGSNAASPYSQSSDPHQANNNSPIPKSKSIESPASGSITKAEGGYTVEELFSKNNELNGKAVKVRGKVVKVSLNIMGVNWVHIQDGSGGKDTNDVTFTTNEQTPEVGSTVLAEGTLAANKNFGAGYLYAVIIEKSTFTQ